MSRNPDRSKRRTVQRRLSLADAAIDCLSSIVHADSSPDRFISDRLRGPRYRHFGARDRDRLFDLVFACLRYRRFLSAASGSDEWSAVVETALKFGGASVDVREAKRSFLSEKRNEEKPGDAATSIRDALKIPAVDHELPDWLDERLETQYGRDRLDGMAAAMLEPASVDLRVNLTRSDRKTVLETLKRSGVEARVTPLSPWGIRLTDRIDLTSHPLYRDGVVEIQDEGSQLIALLLGAKRDEWVVDFCAGAGGKTLAIAAMMRSTGRLYAVDTSATRLRRMLPRLERAGLKQVTSFAIDSIIDDRLLRWKGRVDRVLVDAPCSGLGTLRRNPALKYRIDPAAIDALSAEQRGILTRAAELVKDGGVLVYATCSILAEENEQVVAAFLKDHPDFYQESAEGLLSKRAVTGIEGDALVLSPDTTRTDGFYAVRLRKDSKYRGN